MGRKIYVTAAEMLELRKQGMSNHDIAKSLDICYATVLNYIGKQDGHMEGLAAFKDAPPPKKEEVKEAMPVIPKYEPKPSSERFRVGNAVIELDNEDRAVIVSSDAGDMLLSYSEIPDLVQFLACAMRTRMEVTADAEQVREQDGDSERGEV